MGIPEVIKAQRWAHIKHSVVIFTITVPNYFGRSFYLYLDVI